MFNNRELIRENGIMRYQVIVEGKVLMETGASSAAENFVASLLPEQRSKAQIVPVTSEGKQVLFG